ncbi:transcription factor TFIIIC subunit TFC1 [Aspergillus clavatus NRRL 1]|uniref:RNA polymerase III transcription factor subunit, putative n=1 Tax=Aspergillus clavatus (strain ATCC 1007 / CBS 513.65 / DSM 816 / NCTC 3887 / NRRL 1 / QM 1276 / 107) TaxID=344612 RepID=A1C582_ASPCL|nr:RNA polymerase III transcription factor subunit, putative [Aspergillus clavatus NRRL 1]EAW14850.1 RNA polymerase III transcription factor subunit, putative [Aspergillus clavatus NRRL 1]
MTMTDQQGTRTAPYYSIPPRHIVSIEHPAIIKNIDRALETLEGNAGISKILNPPKADAPAHLLLRPEDAMSRPLKSTSSAANNILLKVTVPRRTGRKRKRGSDEPFTGIPVATASGDCEPWRRSAKQILQSLRDNAGRYAVEPVGMVKRTHVFRGMPDFVYSTAGSAFSNRFREQILSFDYEKMKQFDIDMSKGAISDVDLIPPPSFSHGDIPFTYVYRQNPTVRQSVDTSGNITTINTSQATKIHTYLLPGDIPAVPTKPRENLAPISTFDPILQETIACIEALFQDRPAWTRRGLRNHLKTAEQRYALRHAVPYVGYIFRSGPWRDAIIKFGHDPRTSPDYRIYQTVMFRILSGTSELSRDAGSGRRHTIPRPNEVPTGPEPFPTNTHLFTGIPPLPQDGRMWMFCDITDPLLRGILFPSDPPPDFLRATCEIAVDGWFGSGTLAKAKTIMRAKIQSLQEGRMPDEDAAFERILALPEHAPPESSLAEFTLDPVGASSREMQLAADIRAVIKGSWKGLSGLAGEKGAGGEDVAVGQAEGPKRAAGGKQVQWREGVGEDEEESEGEGEEEALEHAEMLEAQVNAAAEAIEVAATAVVEEEEAEQGQEESDEGGDLNTGKPGHQGP